MDLALHEPTCKVRRHAHVQHLLVADESSLAVLEATLATLPICATGRVFVEVPDASWVGVVDAPARMVVTWLDRSLRRRAVGEAAARAVAAWADEMLCDVDASVETRVLLLGAGSERIAQHLVEHAGLGAASIRAL